MVYHSEARSLSLRAFTVFAVGVILSACQGACPEGSEYVGELNREVLCRMEGVRHGVHRKWHTNGQLILERFYDQGRLHGLLREWYSDGSPKREIAYSNGIYAGTYRRWYTNGQLEIDAKYREHRRSGLYREWYRIGRPRLEYNYAPEGVFEGPQRIWRSSGHPRREFVYRGGTLIGKKFWGPDGRPEALYVPR